MKKVLKVKIHQPSAHYRVPFSYQRRFTFPIPPYSTVKGLICNLLGIKNSNDERFIKIKNGLSIAIYGKYESLTKEYTWFRNLTKKSHIDRFHSATNRYLDRIPQHPGGQMPVKVDTLNNIDILIYISHPDRNFLAEIQNALKNPYNRLSTIYLGRAEDCIVLQSVEYIDVLKQKPVMNIPCFTWIPEKEFVDEDFAFEKYEMFFNSINGNIFRLPTFYEINKNNQRIFNEFVTAKLYEGGSFKKFDFYVDTAENNLPVILSKLRGKKDV